jgi:hypothetical protein
MFFNVPKIFMSPLMVIFFLVIILQQDQSFFFFYIFSDKFFLPQD